MEIIPLTHPPPKTANIRQWYGTALVQVMACRLIGSKLLPVPMLAYCQWDFWEQISMKFESNSMIFIQENAFEIVVCHNSVHFVQGEMS